MKPLLITTSDLHLSPKPPICRKEHIDWWEYQLNNIKFIKEQQDKYKVPLFIAGDLFNDWYFDKVQDKTKWNELILLLKSFNYPIKTIPGQHDLQNNIINTVNSTAYKSLDLVLNCDISNNSYETETYIIDGFSFGTDLSKIKCESTDKLKIIMIHTPVWYNKEPYPGASENGNIKNLYNKLSAYDVVISGDFHKGFVCTYKNTLFINNGSLMRIKADQINYKPFITLLYDDLSYKQIYMPIENDLITKEHIDIASFKENRLKCFTNYINTKIKYKDNNSDLFNNILTEFINNIKIHNETRNLLQEVKDVIN